MTVFFKGLGSPLLFLLLLLLLLPAIITAQTCRNNAAFPLPAETIFQFAKGNNFTFFENIAARANGDLVVTMAVPQPNVFLLQNPASACPTLAPLFSVPGVNGTNGIVEIANRPDVFAVIAGNLSLSGDPANGVPGSWSVWEIDLTGGGAGSETTSNHNNTNTSSSSSSAAASQVDCNAAPPPPPIVTARKIASVPQAPRLNGAAAIPGSSAILLGDSQLGVAFRLDTATGAITTALDLPEMKPVPGAGSIDDALGLNGMKISTTSVAAVAGGGGGGGGGRGNNGSLLLYFTNAAARTMNRVAILPDGSGPVSGAVVETIASVPSAGWLDDLDVRDDGSLWITTNVPTNSLLAIEPTVANATGIQAQFMAPVVAVGSPNLTTLSGPTSAVFGRGTVSNRFLFVACGSGREPAKIVRVDTTSCQ